MSVFFFKKETKIYTETPHYYEAAKLLDLLVQEDFRTKWVGTRLLSDVEEKAREEGCRKIILETSKLHENALRFYTSKRYKLVARIPKLYYGADW